MDKRIELINKYKSIFEGWNNPNSQLKNLYPEQYENIKRKLEGLENGADYVITYHTPENYIINDNNPFSKMMYSVASGICGNQSLDYTNERYIKDTKKFKEVKDIEYDVSKLVNFYVKSKGGDNNE
jgi:hypothetical protein